MPPPAPLTSARRRLGDLLLADGAIGAEKLDELLAEQKRTGEKLGSILVRSGAISKEQLGDVLARQYRSAAFGGVGRRLGDLLVAEGLIDDGQRNAALAAQKRTGDRLGTALISAGAITEERLLEFLGRQYKMPVFSLADDDIDPEAVALVPASLARAHEVMPVARTARSLTLAMADPTDISAIDDVSFATGLQILTVLASPSRLREMIDRCYGPASPSLAEMLQESEVDEVEVVATDEAVPIDLTAMRAAADEAPAVRLLNAILVDAIQKRASDVHLEPEERAFRVRYRVDGVLVETMTPPKRHEAAILSRLKIMANLDIAEHRLPQNGRVKLRANQREVDVRVSTMPTMFGESISVRILDRSALAVDVRRLGFEADALVEFQKAISAPCGLVVITGPTGAGKTTTLYSAVNALNHPGVKILTIEDPIEYNLKGIYQVEVNEIVGRTFAVALRAALRHDPDVLMVGEIRDLETAQIAVRAALTGHLVLTTLHTADAASAVARFVDLGVPPFLLASTLRIVVAQRLVRRACPRCKPRDAAPVGDGAPAGEGRRAAGCAACHYTGVKGRVGIYEVMPVGDDIKELIERNAPTSGIRESARRAGMKTLRELGLAKMVEGVTTMEEVLRVTPE